MNILEGNVKIVKSVMFIIMVIMNLTIFQAIQL